MLQVLQRFLKDESGATVIEYGVIIGVVSIAIFSSLAGLGVSDKAMYDHIATQFIAAMSG